MEDNFQSDYGSPNVEVSPHRDEDVMEVAILAGHILLQNGAEISRVEETMDRICRHYGVHSGSEFVLSNGIFATAGSPKEKKYAKVQHIPVAASNLSKVVAVNQISREIEEGKYTIDEASEALQKIQDMPGKSFELQIVCSGLGSAAFCYLFGGDLLDAVCAFWVGFMLYIFVLKLGAPFMSKIVYNILGGMFLTMVSILFYWSGMGHHLNYMIIGSLMPLIPGVAFINGIRDIADGDYIAGSVRLLDAMLVFFCIAIGVGLCISIVSGVTGGRLL